MLKIGIWNLTLSQIVVTSSQSVSLASQRGIKCSFTVANAAQIALLPNHNEGGWIYIYYYLLWIRSNLMQFCRKNVDFHGKHLRSKSRINFDLWTLLSQLWLTISWWCIMNRIFEVNSKPLFYWLQKMFLCDWQILDLVQFALRTSPPRLSVKCQKTWNEMSS